MQATYYADQQIYRHHFYFGRTNLIEMDLLTTGPPVTTKPYTIPLKYKSFNNAEISS